MKKLQKQTKNVGKWMEIAVLVYKKALQIIFVLQKKQKNAEVDNSVLTKDMGKRYHK